MGDACIPKSALRKLHVKAVCATPGQSASPFAVTDASLHVSLLPDATLYTIMPPLISRPPKTERCGESVFNPITNYYQSEGCTSQR